MDHSARRGLAAGAATVTVAITAAAFWLSYEHLHDVAAGNGLTGSRAWAWPSVIDLFIVAGELLILRAALRGRADWFAYVLAGAGSLGSIALNVAGVGANAARMEYVVAAVPPVAALLAFAAVMRQVHEALVTTASIAPATVHSGVLAIRGPETVPAGVRLLPIVSAAVTGARAEAEVVPAGVQLLPLVCAEVTTEVTLERIEPEPVHLVTRPAIEHGWRTLDWARGAPLGTARDLDAMTASVPADGTRQVVTVPVTITPAELRRRVRKLNAEAVRDTSRPVTIAVLMDQLSLSRRDAAALRREVVEGKRS